MIIFSFFLGNEWSGTVAKFLFHWKFFTFVLPFNVLQVHSFNNREWFVFSGIGLLFQSLFTWKLNWESYGGNNCIFRARFPGSIRISRRFHAHYPTFLFPRIVVFRMKTSLTQRLSNSIAIHASSTAFSVTGNSVWSGFSGRGTRREEMWSLLTF